MTEELFRYSAYVQFQRAAAALMDLYPGDKVRVIRNFKKGEFGWDYGERNKYLGEIYTVSRVSSDAICVRETIRLFPIFSIERI